MKKLTMSEENRTTTRQFLAVGDAHVSAESTTDAEDNLQSQLLDRMLSSSEVYIRINTIVAPLATQLETLIHSIMDLSESNSKRSTDKNRTSERSRSSGQRSATPDPIC